MIDPEVLVSNSLAFATERSPENATEALTAAPKKEAEPEALIDNPKMIDKYI